MKCTVILDEDGVEEIIIRAKARTPLVEEIEALVHRREAPLVGFRGDTIQPLAEEEVYCFLVEDGRTYAVTAAERWLIKRRLYQLEETVGTHFVKINRSCLANLQKIQRFEGSLYGALRVVFRNGHTDYVSRRHLKLVKERLGM